MDAAPNGLDKLFTIFILFLIILIGLFLFYFLQNRQGKTKSVLPPYVSYFLFIILIVGIIYFLTK